MKRKASIIIIKRKQADERGGIIYNYMQKEYKRLEKKELELRQALQELPEGKLLCARNGESYYKWYQSDGHKKVYIPKKNRKLAEQLAAKKYLSTLIEDVRNEKKAIQQYLKSHENHAMNSEKLLTEESEIKNLLTSQFSTLSQELSDWTTSPYESNKKYPEQLKYRGVSGKFVRSKSEVIIDMNLHMNHIPFRYEAALVLGNVTIYPDFTIRHPQTGEVYYWEHFGMMDNPTYAKSTGNKLQLYLTNGIIPSIHLITTYETNDHPLDSEEVKRIIEEFFLR